MGCVGSTPLTQDDRNSKYKEPAHAATNTAKMLVSQVMDGGKLATESEDSSAQSSEIGTSGMTASTASYQESVGSDVSANQVRVQVNKNKEQEQSHVAGKKTNKTAKFSPASQQAYVPDPNAARLFDQFLNEH